MGLEKVKSVLPFPLIFDTKIHLLEMNQNGSKAIYHQANLCQNSSGCHIPAVWASYFIFQNLNLLVYKRELITFTSQEICVSFE